MTDTDDTQPAAPITARQIHTARLLLVVVGAHLRAEVGDRPLAGKLIEKISAWLKQHEKLIQTPFLPVICCDVWYVNHKQLQRRPSISIGGPGVNALSAYYNRELTAAFVRENQIVIQLDPECVDLRVSIWGMNHELTQTALEIFEQKYLDAYLRAVVTQVEPERN